MRQECMDFLGSDAGHQHNSFAGVDFYSHGTTTID